MRFSRMARQPTKSNTALVALSVALTEGRRSANAMSGASIGEERFDRLFDARPPIRVSFEIAAAVSGAVDDDEAFAVHHVECGGVGATLFEGDLHAASDGAVHLFERAG